MLNETGRKLLFTEARSHKGWQARAVSEATLREIYDLMRWGPTSFNSCPARIVFVASAAARERLEPALSATNVAKVMSAPVTAILAYDSRFYELWPTLNPRQDPAAWATREAEMIRTYALRNASLQGAYFIMAARAVGLDCCPMSGFDNAQVDDAFFPGGRLRSNFICAIGYGDPAKLPERPTRLAFEDACVLA